MKVGDELVKLPRNTVRGRGEGEGRERERGEGREKSREKDDVMVGLLDILKVWKDVHVPEAINCQDWKIL